MNEDNVNKQFPSTKKRLHVELTGKCNLKCVYCFQSSWNTPEKVKQELSSDDFKKIIDQAQEIGCEVVTITGGEPFLRRDIWDIIRYCEGLKVEILTNSELLQKSDIRYIGENLPQVKVLKISIDGTEGHDITRKGSSYTKILENFYLFKQYTQCKLIANTIITYFTARDLLSLYKELKKVPIDTWRIDLPFLSGRYVENRENYEISPGKSMEFIIPLLKEYFDDRKPFELELFNLYKSGIITNELFEFDVNLHPCSYSGWRTLCIKPNGDLIFCPSLLTPFSNIKNKYGEINISKAIEDAKKNNFFQISVGDIEKCKNCKYLNICGSGCRADALYWENDILAPDPVACKYMELMEKRVLPILPQEESVYLSKLIKQ